MIFPVKHGWQHVCRHLFTRTFNFFLFLIHPQVINNDWVRPKSINILAIQFRLTVTEEEEKGGGGGGKLRISRPRFQQQQNDY